MFFMKVKTLTLTHSDYPPQLATISSPPKVLYYLGDLLPLLSRPRLAVVGSRRVTPYGNTITTQLARQAAAQGIVIISGLALGVDALAHQAALEAKGATIAVLPCGLDRIYPATNRALAAHILQQGGALVSEYPFETEPLKPNFIARNRIVAGLADGVLITEAALKSGSLHTANFALEQGRAVMAVPGPITSQFSAGTNNLIKTGAAPVTEVDDILDALGIVLRAQSSKPVADNEHEARLLDLLTAGISDGGELLAKSGLETVHFNQTLTMLEITGKIRPLGAGHWAIA